MGNEEVVGDHPIFVAAVRSDRACPAQGIKHVFSSKSESEAVSRPGQGVPNAVVVIAQSARHCGEGAG